MTEFYMSLPALAFFYFFPSVGHSVSLFIADNGNGDIQEFNRITGAFVGTFGTTGANLSNPRVFEFSPPTVAFDSTSSSGSEATTSVTIPASLASASLSIVIIDYAVTGGTATGSGVEILFNRHKAYEVIMRGSDILKKRLEQANKARIEAETLLEEKNLELYSAKQAVIQKTIEIQKIELYHHAIVNGSLASIIINKEGTIQSFNPVAQDIFGYSSSEVIGKNVHLLIPEPEKSKHNSYLQSYLESGNAKVLGIAREVTSLRKDGSLVPLELRISRVDSPGGEIMFLGTLTDISQRKEAEEKLRKTNDFLKNILNSPTNISIISTDLERRITYWNKGAERILGYTAMEMVGHKNIEILYPDKNSKEILKNMIKTIYENGQGITCELVERAKGGEPIWINLTISPKFDLSGKIDGLMGIGENINERKKLQVQLNHAQKMESIGQMAAGIAHEINTPLQYIGDNTRFLKDSFDVLLYQLKEYAQLAEKSGNGNILAEMLQCLKTKAEEMDLDFLLHEIPEAIKQSLEGIGRVSKIVQAMKEFSHPGVKEKKPADLNKAIETTLGISRNEWKYVANVETYLDSDLPLVPCYINDVNQTILNLVINASHAIKNRLKGNENHMGTIIIRTQQNKEWAEILISDTGNGIPAEIQPKIFDLFFTTKEVGHGTGQGLAIAYSAIVKKHRGTITFETDIGKGTLFTVRLPISQKANNAE